MTTVTNALTHTDIRTLLIGFCAAIELDQLRVDRLHQHHPEKFHEYYDDGMWRRWRQSYLDYIRKILPTVDQMPPAMLAQLTNIALNYDPIEIELKERLLYQLCEGASGGIVEEEINTAALLFGLFIHCVIDGFSFGPFRRAAKLTTPATDARARMMRWLFTTDPLHIAEDPECLYGRPIGLVN
jgi:hypothetical protein